jgi:ABC-2 type transport system permease protein
MNTQAANVSESSQAFAAWLSVWLRPLYWSVRRELWENRWIYIALLVAAALFLLGSTVSVFHLRQFSYTDIPSSVRHGKNQYELAPLLIMGAAIIVSVFYCLDALYGERRDRSILFWKSLPVSNFTAVISKLAIPILILPLISFAITVATQLLMLVISSAVLAGSGVDIPWREILSVRVPAIWLYHLVTVHGIWYAPLYCWLLLISAWAPRAPFLWAFLPPFVIYGVEKIAFNTSYFLDMLKYRLMGSGTGMAEHQQDFASTLIPHHFLSTPGLWTGLAVAAIFLYATVQLRRSRGPI